VWFKGGQEKWSKKRDLACGFVLPTNDQIEVSRWRGGSRGEKKEKRKSLDFSLLRFREQGGGKKTGCEKKKKREKRKDPKKREKNRQKVGTKKKQGSPPS